MEKYYNTYDRTFISDYFYGEFTDIDGNKCSGTIMGASVMFAVLAVNRHTGQPEYSVNGTDPVTETENSILTPDLFQATVDAELGVLLIPDTEAIRNAEKVTGADIAVKIVEYTIDIADPEWPMFIEPQHVTESEFVRFIREHCDKFNNSDNYHAQNTAYGYYKVDKEYPRISYAVGYGHDGNAMYCPFCERNKDQ